MLSYLFILTALILRVISNAVYLDVYISGCYLGDIVTSNTMENGCNWTHAYRVANSSWEEHSNYIDKCIPTINIAGSEIESQERLLALVQQLTKLIFARGSNVTLMEQIRDRYYNYNNITSNRLSGPLEIVPVAANEPHDFVTKRGLASYGKNFHEMSSKRVSWSDIGKYVVFYAVGGSLLKTIQAQTKSLMVNRAYKAYVGIGYSLGYFIGESAALIQQGLRNGYQNRSYAYVGARDNDKRFLLAIVFAALMAVVLFQWNGIFWATLARSTCVL